MIPRRKGVVLSDAISNEGKIGGHRICGNCWPFPIICYTVPLSQDEEPLHSKRIQQKTHRERRELGSQSQSLALAGVEAFSHVDHRQ